MPRKIREFAYVIHRNGIFDGFPYEGGHDGENIENGARLIMRKPNWRRVEAVSLHTSGLYRIVRAFQEDFQPNDTIPMPVGSFIRRVAKTPHYDGVKKDGKEPAVIAICGMGPITYHLVNAGQPDLRVL